MAAFRAYLAEAERIEADFQGTIETGAGGLRDLAKIDFILSGASRWPRRYLHEHDYNLVWSAVKGQSEAELERNLPAIVRYIRLAVAARTYNWRARQRRPLVGERRGQETVTAIAKRVFDFRAEQVEAILERRLRPETVLTAERIAEFADPSLLAELEEAYQDGQRQFENQRNSVVFAALAGEFGVAWLFVGLVIRQRRPPTVIGLRSMPRAEVPDTGV